MPNNKKKRVNQKNISLQERNYSKLREVIPRSDNQRDYLDSIEKNIVTLGLGPAGSGKTFLATYMALLYHFSKDIKRIIITRPAVEAGGEKLGFLPGQLDEKMNPYMRPIYDALGDLTNLDFVKDKMERGFIEISPLAFMRGRTYGDCIVILDEAQNATLEQLKMVLTRLGENCKLIIAGDPDQSDLSPAKSGINRLTYILRDVLDVGIIKFVYEDIVRSQIVVDVLRAFGEYENGKDD